MRELKPYFIDDLRTGTLTPIIELVRSDMMLDLQIRHNQVHIYYRGGKILGLRPKRGGGYHTSFDAKYLNNWTERPKDKVDPIREPERSTIIESLADAETWVAAIPQLKRIMDRWFLDHPKKEREHQQLVVDQNNKLTGSNDCDFWILDIEYAKNIADPENPGGRKAARFDLIAMITPNNGNPPRLAFIEMKYEDKALRPPAGIRSHLKDFHSFLSDSGNYESVKAEMFDVLGQKNDLHVLRGDRGMDISADIQAFSNERPLFIFLFAEHNTKSTVLRDELSKMENPSWCEIKVAFANDSNYLLNYADLYDLEKARSLA